MIEFSVYMQCKRIILLAIARDKTFSIQEFPFVIN